MAKMRKREGKDEEEMRKRYGKYIKCYNSY